MIKTEAEREKEKKYSEQNQPFGQKRQDRQNQQLEQKQQDEQNQQPEQEWQWCLVGNIIGEHPYGENHALRYGTKHFRPHAKVFVNLIYGGMGHEDILVIGLPRHSHRYIEVVIARKYVENFRLQRVFTPAVLRRIQQSEWNWWGNTDEALTRLIDILEWLSPAEAEKAKVKYKPSISPKE